MNVRNSPQTPFRKLKVPWVYLRCIDWSTDIPRHKRSRASDKCSCFDKCFKTACIIQVEEDNLSKTLVVENTKSVKLGGCEPILDLPEPRSGD